MGKKNTLEEVASTSAYDALEDWARLRVQEFIQDLLKEEVTEFLGRRSAPVSDGARKGHRNGFGKTRRFAMLNGTIEVRRPRVRDTEEAFESQILPLFHRKSKQLGQMLPELYLHGLAKGDFELALYRATLEILQMKQERIESLKARLTAQQQA